MWSRPPINLPGFKKGSAAPVNVPAAPVAVLPPSSDYLDQRYFAATLMLAAALHVLCLAAWSLMPREQVMNIPVRALSIKLADGEPMTSEELAAAQPDANAQAVESLISEMTQSTLQDEVRATASAIEKALASSQPDLATQEMEKALIAAAPPAPPAPAAESAEPKQFVRNTNVQAKGSERGNSTEKEAELMSRYEQLISLWVEKFKKYPMEARDKGLTGETVVRIRIDRKGNIRHYLLERSTGHAILDRAAIDMVRRANPVPSVPNDYPKGDLLEFLIPVSFNLE